MSNKNEETSAEKQDSNNNTNNEKKEAWGYDLYPERRGTFKPTITNVLIGKEGKEGIEKIKCEKNVYKCIKESKCYLCYCVIFNCLDY